MKCEKCYLNANSGCRWPATKNGLRKSSQEDDLPIFTIQKINEIFNQLFTEKNILFKMSKNAGNIAITEATSNLAKLINEDF